MSVELAYDVESLLKTRNVTHKQDILGISPARVTPITTGRPSCGITHDYFTNKKTVHNDLARLAAKPCVWDAVGGKLI